MTAKSGPVLRLFRKIGKELDITWRFPAVIAGVLLITGGMTLVVELRDRGYSKSGPGSLVAVHRATLADGRGVLAVSTSVHHPASGRSGGSQATSRLEVFAVDDGHSLARVVVDDPLSCAGARAGLLWCDTDLVGGSVVELRDAATLAVRATHATVIAHAPALSRDGHAQLEPSTGHAWLPTSDGRYWHVDPETLAGAVVDAKPGVVDLSGERSPVSSSAQSPIGNLYSQGRPSATLMVEDNRGNSRPISSDTWLDPEFVLAHGGADEPALLLDDGKTIVVSHSDSVDTGTANRSFTALGIDGVKRWTTLIGQGEIAAAWLVDGRLVVALRVPDAQASLLALDPGDGHVIWRVGT